MDCKEFSAVYRKIKEPEIEMHEGSKCYLDPIRKKYVQATPEELVRQKTILYLLEALKIPKEAIEVEYRLSKAGIRSENLADRADIVIFEYNEKEKLWVSLAVVECKAPNVEMTDEPFQQAFRYADELQTPYVTVVNGKESYSYYFDEKDNLYHMIKKLPTYEKMLTFGHVLESAGTVKKRFSFEELMDNSSYYVDDYPVFGVNTPSKDLIFLTNLFECLMLDNNRMPAKKYGYYTMLEDYGTRCLRVGDSSGLAYTGEYRSFRIEKDGNAFFVNLSIFDYGSASGDHNLLTVSMDRKGKSHNSLQYSFKDATCLDSTYHFIHSGRITIGKYGPAKASELKEFIAEKAPHLLRKGKIDLGVLNNNRLLHMDDPEMITFVDNFLTYALLREEFRDIVEARKREEQKKNSN